MYIDVFTSVSLEHDECHGLLLIAVALIKHMLHFLATSQQ